MHVYPSLCSPCADFLIPALSEWGVIYVVVKRIDFLCFIDGLQNIKIVSIKVVQFSTKRFNFL